MGVSITGVYNIVYTAQNTVGLWNNGANCRGGASTYGRKVTVSDTLRPVITLRYKGTKVAQGTRDTTGDIRTDSPHHGQLNTKHVAVAGLALLGYSTRRTAVATSVPV